MDYQNICSAESYGDAFDFGIKIYMSAPIELNSEIRIAVNTAADLIKEEVTRQYHKNNKESQKRHQTDRAFLLDCFPDKPIFVKEIPNGYCHRACCEHLKWFAVPTKIGMVEIGWRKSVISINWSKTEVRRIISNDDVTKSSTMIHAWGYEKAREYLTELLTPIAQGEN